MFDILVYCMVTILGGLAVLGIALTPAVMAYNSWCERKLDQGCYKD